MTKLNIEWEVRHPAGRLPRLCAKVFGYELTIFPEIQTSDAEPTRYSVMYSEPEDDGECWVVGRDQRTQQDAKALAEAWLMERFAEFQGPGSPLLGLLKRVLASDAGRETLHKLATGQGTETDDGKAWLAAKAAVNATSNGTTQTLGVTHQNPAAAKGDISVAPEVNFVDIGSCQAPAPVKTEAFDTIRAMVSLMHERECAGWATGAEEARHRELWAVEVAHAQNVAKEVGPADRTAIEAVLDGMLMENKREAGESSLTLDEGRAIWNNARLVGEGYVLANSMSGRGYLQASQTPVAGTVDFCDAHCTWRDHAEGCPFADKLDPS